MSNEKFVDECLDDYMVCLRKILKEKLIKKISPEDKDDGFMDPLDVQLSFSDYDWCLVMKVTVENKEYSFGWKFGLDGVEREVV